MLEEILERELKYAPKGTIGKIDKRKKGIFLFIKKE